MKNKILIVFSSLAVFVIFSHFLSLFFERRFDADLNFEDIVLVEDYKTKADKITLRKVESLIKQNKFSDWVKDSIDYTDIKTLNCLVYKLDSLNPTINNQKNISKIYTELLYENLGKNFTQYNPDYFQAILNWSNKFKCHSEEVLDDKFLFDVISSFWIGKVAHVLGNFSEADYSIKHQFKFKYLINQCNKHKNLVSIHTPKHEKIIDHIIKNDWAYLLFKFNVGTSFLFKLMFYFVVFFNLFSFVFVPYSLIKKIKNEKNK
jgi:hypothetical protein